MQHRNYLPWMLVACATLCATRVSAVDIGSIAVSIEHGLPVIHWSNIAGRAWIIETSTHVGASSWERVATLTTDAAEVSWADDHVSSQAVFYRVALASNTVPFLDLQRALQRACSTQGIVGASAAAVIPKLGMWLGTFGYSHGKVPIRPQTLFEIGSVTKTYIAATVLRLSEEGRLTLDDPISQWLPELNNAHISPSITIGRKQRKLLQNQRIPNDTFQHTKKSIPTHELVAG